MNNLNNQTPYENGKTCRASGMSIDANPFRNTYVDNPSDAFLQWENGWKEVNGETEIESENA
ncbi:hypothetical protein [Vibrio sp. V15_P4S5T153]|uniref:hypothetical protein n=1 Tax=Vibrio sp. V15_P4S5T153 TaxID=1938669 RepID=UPI000B8F643E|nr:hypothetical protein [Vibrio sp. V15_P4S5T153]OXX64662.1 hypothetical protein B9J89_01900 [Vibrio sp. V15_P4S5T153]